MNKVHVNLGARAYDIHIGNGISDQFAAAVKQACPKATKFFVVADANTAGHAQALGAPLGAHLEVIPSGEESKSLAQYGELLNSISHLGADRQTPVIAVGGGVVGDLGGFVAATYNRGLPLIMVPTTLLSMVDSSVGGKTGINLPTGKNLVGSFHQPKFVWLDTGYLQTLPRREFNSGLAEVAKYGVIQDPEFFAWLEANTTKIMDRDSQALGHIVARSCRLKADVVENDEFETTGLRMILNYGHTFGHAFEAVAGYGTWLHGEAVATGMVCAADLGERQGITPLGLKNRLMQLLTRFELPTKITHAWDNESMLAAMSRDKKNAQGQIKFVLATSLGEVKGFTNVPRGVVEAVLNDAKA